MLCSVCSNWRSVILNHPLFWSSSPIRDDKHSCHLVRLCLECSRDSPIDILAYASYTRTAQLYYP
ncbi:hypothetical protein B0J17DRAFT_653495 [Rhizoctonia solani]|nr:hypothetical protein B0J17DRAFT_653495 [Rhizoctonia solani]